MYYSPLQRAIIAARGCAYPQPEPKPEPVVTPPAPKPAPEFKPPVQVIPFVQVANTPTLKFRTILNTVAASYGLCPNDIKSHRRTAYVVLPRQVYCHLARKHTLRSYPEIGRSLAGDDGLAKDHTTVLHADRKITRLIETDAALAAKVREIEDMLGVVSHESPQSTA